MSDNRSDEPIGFFSLKGGKRIPIFAGQSKREALQQALASDEAKRLNAEQKRQDAAKQTGKTMVKGGKIYFNGQPVDKLDTSEVDQTSSLYPYMDKNGNISDERLAVHSSIIQNYFSKYAPYSAGAEKWAYFTGGGAASGKGQFSDDVGKYYTQNNNPVVVDPDELKKMLSNADLGTSKLDKISTAFYHEESSALAKQIYTIALQHNYPVMFDGTATGLGSVKTKIAQAEKFGYKTQMNFICSDSATVLSNTMHRYSHTGRLVPIGQQFGAHARAYKAVLGQHDKYDKFTLWDNSKRQMVKVATNTKGNKLNVVNKASWSKFQRSGADFTLTKDKVNTFDLSVRKIDKRKGE